MAVAMLVGAGIGLSYIPPSPRFYLRLLELLLSWPVVTGLLIGIFLLAFQAPLDYFIRNISVRFPNGTQLNTQKQEPATNVTASGEAVSKTEHGLFLTNDQQAQLKSAVSKLIQERDTAGNQVQDLTSKVAEARVEGLFWKYKFLDKIYVPSFY